MHRRFLTVLFTATALALVLGVGFDASIQSASAG